MDKTKVTYHYTEPEAGEGTRVILKNDFSDDRSAEPAGHGSNAGQSFALQCLPVQAALPGEHQVRPGGRPPPGRADWLPGQSLGAILRRGKSSARSPVRQRHLRPGCPGDPAQKILAAGRRSALDQAPVERPAPRRASLSGDHKRGSRHQ